MKKISGSFSVLLASLLILRGTPGSAQEEKPPGAPPSPQPPPSAAATPPPATTSAPAKVIYKRPSGAAGGIAVKQSGGTRGAGEKLPSITVLAPDHVALTTQAQPVLFWYQSLPAKAAFQLTLTEPKKAKPLVDVTVGKAEAAGIRGLSLKDHGIMLEPGISYVWHVALIPDPDNRSKDLLSAGAIKRIAAPPGLEEKLAQTSGAGRAVLFAEAGLWYDALQAISSAIAADRQNGSLHELRASLLQQAGLTEAAAGESRH